MQSWWIGLLKRAVRSNIFVGIRDMPVNLLSNPCEIEGMSLMSGKGEKRPWRRKEIQGIVRADGWWSGRTLG
jgi:hypothetical protein